MAPLLVGLHTDDGVLQAEGLHQNAHAADDPLALLQHQPVVSGYVGLTLGAVQDQGIHLADAGADLHVGGEAGAAHSGDARLLDNLHDLLAAQLAVVGMGVSTEPQVSWKSFSMTTDITFPPPT